MNNTKTRVENNYLNSVLLCGLAPQL